MFLGFETDKDESVLKQGQFEEKKVKGGIQNNMVQ